MNTHGRRCEGRFRILNWNIAGAKYLNLKSQTREEFRKGLNHALNEKIREQNPHVITLQEVVRYSDKGDDSTANSILDKFQNYYYFFEPLVDTKHYSAPRKWNQVKKRGGWNSQAFFAQGNATLIRKDVNSFPIFSLPNVKQLSKRAISPQIVKLTAGFYFGDRNTEPRAALITHIVLSQFRMTLQSPMEQLNKPLDIFIANVHLTTFKKEREGIPDIDLEGTRIRLRQIDIITNEIVSRYNSWAKDEYKLDGMALTKDETTVRHKPIWIIAGDFNFTPESDEYRALLNRGFIDLLPNHNVGTKASGLGENPTLTVDYVFAGPKYETLDPGYVQKGIQANRVAIDNKVTISDHLPLLISVPIVLPKQ